MGKVRRGQIFRPSARDWNKMVDRNDRLDELKFSREPAVRTRNSNWVQVRNDSGADVDWHGILGIDGIVFTPTENPEEFDAGNIALKGVTPVIADHTGKFVICQEPIPDGKIGWAAVAGASVVKLNVAQTWHEYADVQAGTDELKTKPGGGAKILYQESGTGSGINAFVRFGEVPLVECEFALTAALATTDATGSADITHATVVGYDTQSITVTNHNAATNDVFEGANGNSGTAYYDPANDAWYIIQMECP